VWNCCALTKSAGARISAFLLPFVLLLAHSASAQMLAGHITAINGNATISRTGRSFAATYGAPINVGDEFATGASGRLTVTLTDNSQLELTESSTLLISENLLNPNGTRAKTSITLLGGLVRSLVRVSAAAPPNYEVHTPNAVASARGTTYDTYYARGVNRPGYTGCKEFSDISVFDGTVVVSSLANPSSPAVDVHTGQKTTVPCGLAVLPASALSAAAKGAGTATIAGAIAGGLGVIGGGVVGGIAGTGGFGGGPTPTPAPGPISPVM
jgi:ferric-dicitrate binding protein FerR (iron transport regulator)